MTYADDKITYFNRDQDVFWFMMNIFFDVSEISNQLLNWLLENRVLLSQLIAQSSGPEDKLCKHILLIFSKIISLYQKQIWR